MSRDQLIQSAREAKHDFTLHVESNELLQMITQFSHVFRALTCLVLITKQIAGIDMQGLARVCPRLQSIQVWGKLLPNMLTDIASLYEKKPIDLLLTDLSVLNHTVEIHSGVRLLQVLHAPHLLHLDCICMDVSVQRCNNLQTVKATVQCAEFSDCAVLSRVTIASEEPTPSIMFCHNPKLEHVTFQPSSAFLHVDNCPLFPVYAVVSNMKHAHLSWHLHHRGDPALPDDCLDSLHLVETDVRTLPRGVATVRLTRCNVYDCDKKDSYVVFDDCVCIH